MPFLKHVLNVFFAILIVLVAAPIVAGLLLRIGTTYLWLLLAVGCVLDSLTTYLGVQHYGIESEQSPIARPLMLRYGVVRGLVIATLVDFVVILGLAYSLPRALTSSITSKALAPYVRYVRPETVVSFVTVLKFLAAALNLTVVLGTEGHSREGRHRS